MKNKLLLSLIIVFVSISTLKAKTVNSETAALVAKNYYFQQVNTFENELSYNAIIIKNSITETRAGNTIAYIYEFTNGGMVVVSGQDAFDPVIYYSSNKYTTWKLANQNPEFQYFINSFFDAVEYTIKTNYQPEENITAAWQQYTVANPETLIAAKNDVEVGPLLKTEWNQDYPYNYYAPLANGGPGGRCYAGCVATAMSVVMEYWRWPLQGTGQTAYYCYPYGILEVDFSQAFYNWDAMLTTLDGNKSEKAIFAIAELQYNAGVSVQMSYDPTGSGAQSGSVPNAVQSFFKYPYANYFSRDNNEATWVSTIIEQLDNGYVLYYSGHSSDGGHAWNCDGYRIIDGVTTFHQNFGWGGSSNGWFSTGNPGGFSSLQGIVKDFYPKQDEYPYYCSGTKILTSKSGRVNDGSGPINNYLTGTDAGWLIQPQGEYDSVVNITLSWESFDVATGDVVKIYDGTDQNATLIGEYSGNTLPETFTSSGNTLFIKFNSTNEAPGFTFVYTTTRPTYCSGTTHITEPAVIRPAPEGKYYNPSSTCAWTVDMPDNQGTKLEFSFLDTAEEGDFVQIYDQGTGNSLGIFYGTDTPETLYTSADGAYIIFKSNMLNTAGFGFEIECSPHTIGIIELTSTTLDIYPNPCKDYINMDIKTNKPQHIDYEIVETTGSIVDKGSFITNSEKYTKLINIPTISAGIYFIRIKTSEDVITKKFIVE